MDISEGNGLASEHDTADHPLVCVVHELCSNKIRGWAIDARAPHLPASLHVLIDGEEVAQVRCNQPRDDVASATSFNRLSGFEVTLPQRYSDNREHTFEIRDSYDGAQPISSTMKGFKRSSLQFKGVQIPDTRSMVDEIEDGTVKGWVLVQDVGAGRFTGGCTVRLTVNGEPVADAKANLWRPDVGREHNADFDDGSQLPELSKQISSFERHDERIRSVRRARNWGISRATNSALEAARGAWVS